MKNYAIKVFQEEAKALINLINLLDDNFENVVREILNTEGRVIVTGIGKSGIIGKKISTTLASTGTPSFFLHPAEAFHGDLGMIKPIDVIIAITNSGETDELLKLVPFIKENGNILISITGNPNSTLAKNSHYHLNIHVDKEVCPLDLAPTTSATTTLVMGDALVVALMNEKGFKPIDYAKFHPGGNLGRRLLTRIFDVMLKDELPTVHYRSLIPDVIYSISNGGVGLTVIVNENKEIKGIVTDGDIRRMMQKFKAKLFDYNAEDIMNPSPILIDTNLSLDEADKIFIENKINTLLITKENKLIGILPYKKLHN
jgi:arabinose-5-phosphate isomerase